MIKQYFLTAQAILTWKRIGDEVQQPAQPQPLFQQQQQYQQSMPQPSVATPQGGYPGYPNTRAVPMGGVPEIVHPINPNVRGGEIGSITFNNALAAWRNAARYLGSAGGVRVPSPLTIAHLFASVVSTEGLTLVQRGISPEHITHALVEDGKDILFITVDNKSAGATVHFIAPSDKIDISGGQYGIAVVEEGGNLADFPDWFFISGQPTYPVSKEPSLGDLVEKAGQKAAEQPFPTAQELDELQAERKALTQKELLVPQPIVGDKQGEEKLDDGDDALAKAFVEKCAKPVLEMTEAEEAAAAKEWAKAQGEPTSVEAKPVYVILDKDGELAAVKVAQPAMVHDYIETLKEHFCGTGGRTMLILDEDFGTVYDHSGEVESKTDNRRALREAVKYMVTNPENLKAMSNMDQWKAGGVTVVGTEVLTVKQVKALGEDNIKTFDDLVAEHTPK